MTDEEQKAWDMFAAAALTGCLAYSHYNESWGDYHNNCSDTDVSIRCARIADAMMEQRKARM